MSLSTLIAANAAAAAAAGAGKKASQVQLQAELNTDDEWNKFLQRDGLLVIDVYSEWCGPCIGMVGNLKKIKVEIGGDNLHLAIAKSDSIECLKRFRHRSEPTWMFIAAGQLVNVVFGADAPRIARTIQLELKHEELARSGDRERPQRAPHELTPQEQEVATALEKIQEERKARETAALAEARTARREARAKRLEMHFVDLCPALMLPHAQKHLRKVSDALEPHGVVVADKCPLVVGQDIARVLAIEDPEIGMPATVAALSERPSLILLLKKLPDKEGEVIEICRRVLCGDGIELDEDNPKKTLQMELRADSLPGIFVPADRHQRAAVLDILFPKLVGGLVEPPAIVEPPHVAMVFGAWQRRAVLAAAAAPDLAGRVLRHGFFLDTDVKEPKLLAKTIDQYELRPEKDYNETLALAVSVGEADLALWPPPSALRALGPLHESEDAVAGAKECAALFPPGYSVVEPRPKAKHRKRKKKRHENKEDVVGEVNGTSKVPPEAATDRGGGEAETEAGGEGEGEADVEGEGEGEGDADGEGEGEGEADEEEAEAEEALNADKATSPPPQTPH